MDGPNCCICCKASFSAGLCSYLSLRSAGFFFAFSCLKFYIFQRRGLLCPLMIADKVFSIALGPIFAEKTSYCCSIDLSKTRSITIDNSYENSPGKKKKKIYRAGVVPISEWILSSPHAFPTPSETRKGKGQKQKTSAFVIHF